MEWGQSDPIDLIIPLAYGGYTDQSVRLFHGYKSERNPTESLGAGPIRSYPELHIAMMLLAALDSHRPCMEGGGGPLSSVASVPSSHGRDSLHRIVGAVAQASGLPLVTLGYVGPPEGERSYRPEWYPPERRLDNEHLLVVDDTWVTGARPRSVAGAARAAGAARISVLTAARWLKRGWGPSNPFFDDPTAQPPFDPALCPVTGGTCPT